MPMPPPKPTTEGPRDRHVVQAMQQLVRALRDQGPVDPEQLATLVGARYWEPGTYDRALALCVADGLAVRQRDGRLAAS